ncbi:MAG: patatin-like phospholipase family protein, partial [Pseudomonadota bacterium]
MSQWTAEASSERGFFQSSDSGNFDPKAVALTLSGGGYRATLFHTGAILRLNELGVLSRLARVSSVSGGSITAGILAMNWAKLGLGGPGSVASDDAIHQALVQPVLRLTSKTLDVKGGFLGLVPWKSAGNELAKLYDHWMFGGLKLKDLVEQPLFVFNATNLQTGYLFRFTRDYLLDSRALRCEGHSALLSEAVAASSGFPPVLSPLRLDLPRSKVTKTRFTKGKFDDPMLRRRPVLTDGGVYDNLGLESVWKACGVIISSYSGFNNDPRPDNFNFAHTPAVIETFLASSIDWRERVLIKLF